MDRLRARVGQASHATGRGQGPRAGSYEFPEKWCLGNYANDALINLAVASGRVVPERMVGE